MPHSIRAILLALLLAGCQSVPVEALAPLPPNTPPVRFLLTFDDGPSIREEDNPTLSVHAQLADNPVQPGIKAIFFVQTRNRSGGGTARGKAILRQAHAAGHILGLHSGSARGHIRHTKMPPEELAQSLVDGKADLIALTGEPPRFVRPTFWGHNETTRRVYAENGLEMLLTDINGADGFSSAYHTPLNRFGHLRADLAQVRAALARGDMPVSNGHIPVVVTFHDLNSDTAEHLTEYLTLLVDETRRLGMPLADKPFYDRAPDVTTVATLRTTPPDGVAEVRRHWAARKQARAIALVPATAK